MFSTLHNTIEFRDIMRSNNKRDVIDGGIAHIQETGAHTIHARKTK